MAINKKSQEFINRIAAVMEKPPKFNLEKVTEALENYYKLLDVPMPKIEVAKDLVLGYKIVWGAARGAGAINTGLKDERIIKYIAIETEMLKALENGLGIFFPMKDKLVLVPFPEMQIDERKRLNSLEGPAVDWSGGMKFYFINGVKFDKKLWEKVTNNELKAKQILKLENIEQRMIALKVRGADKLLDELKAILLDKSEKGNELYLLKDIFSQNAYFLKYTDPSTGRVYVSGIDPEVGKNNDADESMAWKFNISKKDYLNIRAQA